jgi:HNH endonuclease
VPRIRAVQTGLDSAERRCLYCLGDGPSTSDEHVIPAAFGLAQTARWIIPPGGVCDDCNSFLGNQVDAPFVHRFDLTLARALGGVVGRQGRIHTIKGRDATAQLDVSIDGEAVRIFASRAEPTEDGGLDIEIRPETRDPPDIVLRTVRALWKMGLGGLWHADREIALESRWDHLRLGALGHPFTGYLLQQPMVAAPIKQVHLDVRLETDDDPGSITFLAGGVILSAPIMPKRPVSGAELSSAGWEIRSTKDPAQDVVHLRLEPDEPHHGE